MIGIQYFTAIQCAQSARTKINELTVCKRLGKRGMLALDFFRAANKHAGFAVCFGKQRYDFVAFPIIHTANNDSLYPVQHDVDSPLNAETKARLSKSAYFRCAMTYA
ncbi:hypothetical protein D3C80_1611100 [compost metagenome]